MPFTVSHIAAVLPLKRLPLCFPALVIGAMSPDFTYIIEIYGPSIQAHSIAGIVYFSLPVSWLVLIVYEKFLRDAWATLFPWLHNQIFRDKWYTVPLSIILGAATHVIWDSFTHKSGYAVIHLSALQWTLLTVGNYPLTIFKLLHHGSTVVGGLAVALAIKRAAKHTEQGVIVTSRSTFSALVGVILIVTLIISAPLLLRSIDQNQVTIELFAVRIAFRMLAATAIVALTYPIFVWVRRSFTRSIELL